MNPAFGFSNYSLKRQVFALTGKRIRSLPIKLA